MWVSDSDTGEHLWTPNKVSILVVLDVGFRLLSDNVDVSIRNVSILVVLDVGFRLAPPDVCLEGAPVSILVVLDVGFRPPNRFGPLGIP